MEEDGEEENEEVGMARDNGSLTLEDPVFGDKGSFSGDYNPEDDDQLFYDEGDLGPSNFYSQPTEFNGKPIAS